MQKKSLYFFMKAITRRHFLLQSGAMIGAASAGLIIPQSASSKRATLSNALVDKKSDFCLWQLNTQCNTIGNSYIFLTKHNQVVVMDGGYQADEFYLRGFLAMLGNRVHTWFVSHPHPDHAGSLNEILKNPRGLKIGRIIHSRFSEPLIMGEAHCADFCHDLYHTFDQQKDINIVDMQSPGLQENIDGLNFKILGVTNHEILRNHYNNSSIIIRVWDKKKSFLFLGDAGIECGNKLLQSPYAEELDCDYMQMAHHGQNGCNEAFYKKVNFRACLWSTPQWVWENNQGKGINTGVLKTFETRRWMDEKSIKEHYISWQGLVKID